MGCDIDDNCTRPIKFYLVTERPSDKSEIVCTMATCEHHVKEIGTPVDNITEWHNYIVATSSVLDDYIHSALARTNGHLWLTI